MRTGQFALLLLLGGPLTHCQERAAPKPSQQDGSRSETTLVPDAGIAAAPPIAVDAQEASPAAPSDAGDAGSTRGKATGASATQPRRRPLSALEVANHCGYKGKYICCIGPRGDEPPPYSCYAP